jgi:hypothetical protein
MNRFCRVTLASLAAGCAESVGTTDEGNYQLDGVTITAAVVELSDKLVSVQATLSNTTAERIDLHYPAGCPVRIRLYRALDDALVYDEGIWECNYDVGVDLTVPPGGRRVLTSGTRFSWEIAGDSLPLGAYVARAILRIVGQNPIEVEAGLYNLRVVSPPGPAARRISR